ncbi:MAG: AraC family transcriptional regulator [Candidatus Cryptobacteroides sp.]
MANILSEITPLSQSDCFYVVDRRKNGFNYPIHHHKELELNFIHGGQGAQRIVGDHIGTIGDLELALIGSEHLEHTWDQGVCQGKNIREITIQFHSDLFSKSLLSKNQFSSIDTMLKKSANGILFPPESIMKIYAQLDTLSAIKDGFEQFLTLMNIFYILSNYDYKVLASNTFANVEKNCESGRIQKVKDYISSHFAEEMRLEDLASIAGMSPGAFSRFFRLNTGKTLIDYIIDIRLGAAARSLVDSSSTISEICFNSGFNNISNFNRSFKKSRGMTPHEFRSLYKKHKVIV